MIRADTLPCRDEFTERLLRDAEEALALYDTLTHRRLTNVLDIGAHHGTFALVACYMGADRVYAVEACATNYAGLLENIRAARIPWWRVVPIHAAALEGPCSITPLYATRGNNSGQYSCYFDPQRYETSEHVFTVQFSQLLAAAPRWDYVKVDVEGAEWSWLNGPEAAAKSVPHFKYLDIELHPLSNRDYYPEQPLVPHTLSDVDQWFRAAGCRIVWREEHPTRLAIVAP